MLSLPASLWLVGACVLVNGRTLISEKAVLKREVPQEHC